MSRPELSAVDRARIIISLASAFRGLIAAAIAAEQARSIPIDDRPSSLDEVAMPVVTNAMADALDRADRVFVEEICAPLQADGGLSGRSVGEATGMIIFEACAWICRQLCKAEGWDRAKLDLSREDRL